MELLTEAVAIIGLTGGAGVGIGIGLVAAGFPLMLLVGLLDGPTGGRLSGDEND